MPSDVTRDEFNHLATRTDIVEREVEGEKMVVRHILEQTRLNSADIAALTRKVDGLDRKVDGLDRKFDDLKESLPSIVGEAVREAIEPLIRKR